MNQGVPRFKARHNPFGRIKLEHSAKVKSKIRLATLCKEKVVGTGDLKTAITFTETDDSRPALSKYPPLLKAFAGFNSKETLCDVATIVSSHTAATELALMRKEVSYRFEGNAAVEVKSKPSAQPG